ILIDDTTSLFSTAEIQALTPSTQNHDYRDPTQRKNFVRRSILPGLTWDRDHVERQQRLAARGADQPILIIGSGDRGEQYRKRFSNSLVVLSDVHLQFDADCAIDAHQIPFADRFFGLVVAEQVLEHTSQPWLVAAE